MNINFYYNGNPYQAEVSDIKCNRFECDFTVESIKWRGLYLTNLSDKHDKELCDIIKKEVEKEMENNKILAAESLL